MVPAALPALPEEARTGGEIVHPFFPKGVKISAYLHQYGPDKAGATNTYPKAEQPHKRIQDSSTGENANNMICSFAKQSVHAASLHLVLRIYVLYFPILPND